MPEEIQDYFRSTASQMKARSDIIKGVVIQGRERNLPVGDTCEQLHSVLEQNRGPEELAPSGYVLGFLGVTGKTANGWEKTNVSKLINEICVLEQDWCLGRSLVDENFHLFSRDGWYYFYWRLLYQLYNRVFLRERAAWNYPIPEEVLQI